MSAVSLLASFHFHDCRNDWLPKNGLGSISIATSFRDHLQSPGEDRLVLFTMAACIYTNVSRHATHWIRRGNSLIYHVPYSDALHQANLETLSRRRQSITTKLFDSITCNSDHKLHELLPPRNNCESNLRRKRNFNVPLAKTKRLRTHFYIATVINFLATYVYIFVVFFSYFY